MVRISLLELFDDAADDRTAGSVALCTPLLRLLAEDELIKLEETAECRVGRDMFSNPKSRGKYDRAGVMLPKVIAEPAMAARTVRMFMIHRGNGK